MGTASLLARDRPTAAAVVRRARLVRCGLVTPAARKAGPRPDDRFAVPHLLREGELVLRFGHFRSVRVPLEGLAVRTGAVTGHKRKFVLEDDGLLMSVMGDTNVDLRFHPPGEVEVAGQRRPSSRISFYADDPGGVARLLRARDPSARS
jgi:hypothetical protein